MPKNEKDNMQMMLYPINVNDNLEIEDYDHLYKEAVEIKQHYEGFIGTARQCRDLKRRVNKLMRGLNNVRKEKAKPHRKKQKAFKSQIDNLIDVVGVVKKNMDKQLTVYKKAWQDKLKKKLQPDMNEICVNNGIDPIEVPDEVIAKKSMSKSDRLDLMVGTVKKIAEQKAINNAKVFHGKAINVNANGEIKPLKNVTVKKMTFIGSKLQLHYLHNYIKKNGLNVKDDR